jgi:hypothetical protein
MAEAVSIYTTIPPELARQQRDRDRALKRLAKLRKRASDEIERLIGFLDQSDTYVMTEWSRKTATTSRKATTSLPWVRSIA